MVVSLIDEFATSLKSILGTGAILVLFVLALFYIFSYVKKTDEGDSKLPFLLSAWGTVSFAIAWVVRKLCRREEETKTEWVIKKITVILLAMFVITISGKRILSPDLLKESSNMMHMPDGLDQAFDVILSESEGSEGILVSPGYGNYASAYSSRLYTAYNEPKLGNVEDYQEEDRLAYTELTKSYPDMSKVVKSAQKNNCDYIILKSNIYWPQVPLTELGYDFVGEYGEFSLYKKTEEANK